MANRDDFESGVKTAGLDFSWPREYGVHRNKSVQAGETRGGDQASAKHEDSGRYGEEDNSRRQCGCKNSWGGEEVSELLAADCKKMRGPTQNGRMRCSSGTTGCMKRRRTKKTKKRRGSSEPGQQHAWSPVQKEQQVHCTTSRNRQLGEEVCKCREGARPMKRCQGKRKERTKHWQCDSQAQGAGDKPWRNEELRNLDEGLPGLREGKLERAARSYRATNGERLWTCQKRQEETP